MDKKIIHEVKLPRVITVALYAIAIGLLANVFKPVVMGHPAFAELNNYDNINIAVTHDFQNPLKLSGKVAQVITVGGSGSYSFPVTLRGKVAQEITVGDSSFYSFPVNLQSHQYPVRMRIE